MAVRQLSDGNDDGTVLGQSTSDKIGFFGITTPVAQLAVVTTVDSTTITTVDSTTITTVDTTTITTVDTTVATTGLTAEDTLDNILEAGFIGVNRVIADSRLQSVAINRIIADSRAQAVAVNLLITDVRALAKAVDQLITKTRTTGLFASS